MEVKCVWSKWELNVIQIFDAIFKVTYSFGNLDSISIWYDFSLFMKPEYDFTNTLDLKLTCSDK